MGFPSLFFRYSGDSSHVDEMLEQAELSSDGLRLLLFEGRSCDSSVIACGCVVLILLIVNNVEFDFSL